MIKYLIVVILIGSIFIFYPQTSEFHIHADFKVYIEGNEVNFSQQQYMTDKYTMFRNDVHLHDLDGDVIHFHKEGITLGDFFDSLNIHFNSTCFVTEEESFCSTDTKSFLFYVNGEKNDEFQNYEPKDLDRILITFAPIDLEKEINSVTDKACIQSGSCPERGSPIDESSCSAGNCVI